MKKALLIVLALMISVVFAATGFTQDNPPPPLLTKPP